MKKLIADYLNDKMGLIGANLAILAMASVLFAFKGAALAADTFSGTAQASVIAIGGGAVVYLFWWAVLKIVPPMKSAIKRGLAFVVIFIFIVVIFWLSSALNVAGMRGKDALQLHFVTYAGTLEESAGAQFARALQLESVLTDINIEVARYEAAIEAEIKRGAYSGRPGVGAVSNALTGVKGRLAQLRSEIAAYLTDAKDGYEKAKAHLDVIRKIAVSNESVKRRMRALTKESDALRAELAEMDAGALAETVRRAMDALPREADLHASFSRNAGTAERQRAALARVRTDIDQSGQVLSAFLDDMAAYEPVTIEPFESITGTRAVMVYWKNYLPFWAGGIALDVAPLFIVILLMMALDTKSKAELARIRMERLTFGDLFYSKQVEEMLRRSGIDPDTLKSMAKDLLGKDEDE